MPCWAGLHQAFCGCRRKGKPAGWAWVWTNAPVHGPSSQLPAELQVAAPVHEMKAVGELLAGQGVLGLCAVLFAAAPFGT